MRRIVSVWLPRWPILRFLRAQSSAGAIAPDLPFVLTSEAAGGPRIAAANMAAEHFGIGIGQTLSDARARAGGLLQVEALQPDRDAAALRRLALWATRYSPAASPWGNDNGGDGFFLDITGCAHLFGGEEALLRDLIQGLACFNLVARCAIAGTPGAAWALSHAWPSLPLCLGEGQEREALRPLPVEALRLGTGSSSALRRLGFKTIGRLVDSPRAPFAARFEGDVLLRLDQALGLQREALRFISAPPAYHARETFLDPISNQADLVATAAKLVSRLTPALRKDGVGIRSLRLDLFRVDGEVEQLSIGMAAPTRDPFHIGRLLALKLDRPGERLAAGFGFDCVTLSVSVAEKIAERQGDLEAPADFDTSAERRARLVDTLRQRLGEAAVRQFHALESHIPERAEILRQAEDDVAWPSRETERLRPPLLLARPEEAEVVALIPDGPPRRFRWRGKTHAVARAQGPERLADEWWGDAGGALTRDYFRLECEAGRRFWLYREGVYGREVQTARWFVHGLFA